MVEGVSYQTAVVDEQIRKSNLKAAIKRGNHASANLHPDEIHKLMMKDVGHGFVLPLSLEGINNLRGAELAPLGVAKQFSIDENGEQIPKFRATHDQSFAPLQGDSVNERIDRTSLLDCNYGFTLQRLIHAVLVLRHRHPLSPILLSKVGLDSAYSNTVECIAPRILRLNPASCLTLSQGCTFDCHLDTVVILQHSPLFQKWSVIWQIIYCNVVVGT